MSESDQNTLKTVLGNLRATYKSIDIRAVLGKSNQDESWYCIILKARLTYEDILEIRKKQNEMTICHVDNERFKLVFDCRSIDMIDTFLNEIEQGEINIAGISARPIGDGYQTIRNNKLVNDPGFANDNEKCGYVHKLAYTTMKSNLFTTIHDLGITPNEIGIRIDDISYCFNTTSNILNNLNNIMVLLPIYCKRLHLLSKERGKYISKYQIHRALREHVKARVRVSPDGEIASFKHIEEFDLIDINQKNNQMVITTLPWLQDIEENDHIQIEVFHKSIQVIKVEDNFWASEVFKKRVNPFWLKNVIERIDPNLSKLESWLEGTGKEENRGKNSSSDFEKAVTILMALCGLRTVHVGDVYEKVTVQSRRESHKKTSVSIDIVVLLPSEEDNEIFILQCTTDWNKEKIDEVLDISNEFRNTLPDDIIVQPVLITAVNADKISSSKESAEDRKVKVITIEQLRMLLDKIKENEKPYELVKSLLI